MKKRQTKSLPCVSGFISDKISFIRWVNFSAIQTIVVCTLSDLHTQLSRSVLYLIVCMYYAKDVRMQVLCQRRHAVAYQLEIFIFDLASTTAIPSSHCLSRLLIG
jgi:hypothetical protein